MTGASRPAGDRWRLAHVRCSACGHALRYHDAVACVLPWCDCLPYTPLGAGISARWHRGLLSIRDERPRPASPLRVQVVVVEDA